MHRSRYRISLAEELVFKTQSILPIGYYFNARLEMEGEDENLNCVVKIVRQAKTEDGCYFYGCEFVGRLLYLIISLKILKKDMGIMHKLFGKQEEIFYSKRAILDRKQNA